MELGKELWEKTKKHREEGKIAYLHHRTIVVKRRNNQGLIQLKRTKVFFKYRVYAKWLQTLILNLCRTIVLTFTQAQ